MATTTRTDEQILAAADAGQEGQHVEQHRLLDLDRDAQDQPDSRHQRQSRTLAPDDGAQHQQEGQDYDAERFITPDAVATTILTALDLPRDAEITDLTVRPGR